MDSETRNAFFDNMDNFKGIMGINFGDLINTDDKYSVKEVQDALTSKDRLELIDMSNYFFATSGEYRNLIYRLSNMNIYRYVITPLKTYDGKGKNNNKNITKQYQNVMDYSIKTKIESMCNNIDFYVLRDGGFFGYEREIGKDIVMQQLPARYCRSRYTDPNGNYMVEFNVKFFDDNFKNSDARFLIFEQMPEEFEQLYNEYKAGGSTRGSEWMLLDMTKTRCHMLTDDGIPFFSDVFADLIKHNEYKEIDLLKSKLNLYKIIYQKVPLTKDGSEPITSPEEFQSLHRGAKQMVGGDGIDVLTTLCDVGTLDLSDKTEKTSNFIENGLKNIYNSLAASQFIFNSGSTPSTTGLEKNIRTIEAMFHPLVQQHQRWYDTRFSRMTGAKTTMVLTFLGITIWNEKEKVLMLKEQAMASGSKLAYFASTGINQFVFDSLADFENDFLMLPDRLRVLASSHTTSGDESGDNGEEKADGRPKADPDEASDDTVKQNENGVSEEVRE